MPLPHFVHFTVKADGYFTAVANYTGSATSSYVKGYTVTADYTGTVSRINLNKTRYVAIFEGTPLKPQEPEPSEDPNTRQPAASVPFNWAYLLAPLGAVALIGGGVGVALFLKRRNENEEDAE